MNRVNVIGTSGSGKTRMARDLSKQLGVPHIELDALHWEPNWVEASPAIFRARVERAISVASWTLDGNYSRVRDLVWQRADTIVWLNYDLHVVMWRVWWRTMQRTFGRQELWNGNRESLRTTFFSRNSILLWALTTHARRRREYPELLARPEHAHLQVVQFRNPRDADKWLHGIKPNALD